MRQSLAVGAGVMFFVAFVQTAAAADPPTDLAKQLAAAPRLETEDLCEPVKTVREGMLLWAPNPDGKTWDMLQIYFPQVRRAEHDRHHRPRHRARSEQVQTDRGWNFHLCPRVVAPNGKLFISVLERQAAAEDLPLRSGHERADARRREDARRILGETHPLVLGTDGKLYAIGQHPEQGRGRGADRSRDAGRHLLRPDRPEPRAEALAGAIPAGPTTATSTSPAARCRGIWWPTTARPASRTRWPTTEHGRRHGQRRPAARRLHGSRQRRSSARSGKTADYWLHEGKADRGRQRSEGRAAVAAAQAAARSPPRAGGEHRPGRARQARASPSFGSARRGRRQAAGKTEPPRPAGRSSASRCRCTRTRSTA